MTSLRRSSTRTRRPRRILRNLLVLTLIVTGFVSAGALQPLQAAQAAGVEPVPIGKSLVWVSQEANTRLRAAVQGTGTFTFGPRLGPENTTLTYNAIGYRASDRYLYGMVFPFNKLIRVGGNGETEVFNDAVSGLPARTPSPGGARPGFNQGTFGGLAANGVDYSNTLFIREGNANPRLYAIDIEKNSSTLIDLVTTVLPTRLLDVPNLTDLVWKDGYLWGLFEGEWMYRITPAGINQDWKVMRFAVGTLKAPDGKTMTKGVAYGAQWVYGNGDIGVSANRAPEDVTTTESKIFQLHIDNATTATPTFKIVSVRTGPTSDVNDGASYLGPIVDLGIVKTAEKPKVFAGQVVKYTLTVTNHSIYPSSGFVVTDPIPENLSSLKTTTPGCTITGQDLSCSGGALEPGMQVQIQVEGKTQNGAVVQFPNTATVTGNEYDDVLSNNTSTAVVETITGGEVPPALTIAKKMHLAGHVGEVTSLNEAGAPRIVAGTSVTWDYVVTNTGDVGVNGIAVTDDRGVIVGCPKTLLNPGESMICGGTGIVGLGMYGFTP